MTHRCKGQNLDCVRKKERRLTGTDISGTIWKHEKLILWGYYLKPVSRDSEINRSPSKSVTEKFIERMWAFSFFVLFFSLLCEGLADRKI